MLIATIIRSAHVQMLQSLLCVCVYIQVPVIAVVGNDACWSQIARDQIRILGRGTACDLAVSYTPVRVFPSPQTDDLYKKAVKIVCKYLGTLLELGCQYKCS